MNGKQRAKHFKTISADRTIASKSFQRAGLLFARDIVRRDLDAIALARLDQTESRCIAMQLSASHAGQRASTPTLPSQQWRECVSS